MAMLNKVVPTELKTVPFVKVFALTAKTSLSGRSKGIEALRLVPSASSQLPPVSLTIAPTSGAGSPLALSFGPGAPLTPKPLLTATSLTTVVWLPDMKAAT